MGIERPGFRRNLRDKMAPGIREVTPVPLVGQEIAEGTQITHHAPSTASQFSSIQPIRAQLQDLSRNISSSQGMVEIKGGRYRQSNRVKDNAPTLLKWYMPVITETYTIDNPDGTQTVYSQGVKRGGVYEETYSKKDTFGKRHLVSRESIGQSLEFIPERNPDGSIVVQKTYAGTLHIYSKEYFDNRREKDALVDKEPLSEMVERLHMRTTPFPYTQAEVVQMQYEQAILQGTMNMVKGNLPEQIKLGVATTAITGLSEAFLFGVPSKVFGAFSALKPLLDTSVVVEAYQLLTAPNTKAVKEKLKPVNLITDLIKNPFIAALAIIQPLEQIVKSISASRQAMREFQRRNPYIRDKHMLKAVMHEEQFDATHRKWVDQLASMNPHLSLEDVKHVAYKYLAEQDAQRFQLLEDFNKAKNVNMIPLYIYGGIMLPSYALSFITGGASLVVGGVVAPLASGIARSFVSYGVLKGLKEEIQRERPYELQKQV